MAGKKHDEGKLDWHALPMELVELLVPVAVNGANKYGRHSILQPIEDAGPRHYSATMRHLSACQLDPLAIDPESGCYHAAHAAYDLLARLYQCEARDVIPRCESGLTVYAVPPLDDGDDWSGGKGQCSLERESQIVAEEVRAFGEQLAAKLNNTILCHGCGRRWPLGSEQGRSVSDTGRCIVCRADEDRATYTVPPPQDGDDDPIVHVVPDRTPQSGEVEASASTKRKYAEPITWLPCPND